MNELAVLYDTILQKKEKQIRKQVSGKRPFWKEVKRY